LSSRKIHCTLEVNHVEQDLLVHADETLLDVLREQLALCGTKRGCNHGVCGACNVLVDGMLVRACLMLAVEVDQRPVVTVEGLADGRGYTDIQQALSGNLCRCSGYVKIVEAAERLAELPR
jgi:aerobic-type carbon monoxide dehydrogenase small subunit (CoxS/CutS family)